MALYASLEGMADNIVEVVRRMFFYYVYDKDTIDDLKQEGYLIIYELLEKGLYDPSKNLRNYLFTGVRNAMTNYLYHVKKESHADLSDLDKYENVVGVYDIEEYDIDVELIKSITDRYSSYGNLYIPVMEYLNNIGITKVVVQHIEQQISPMIQEAVITLVIWELYYKEENK